MCAGREGGSPRICHGALFPLGASLQGRVRVGDTPPTQSSPLPPRAPSRLLLLPTDRNRPRPLGARPPQPSSPSCPSPTDGPHPDRARRPAPQRARADHAARARRVTPASLRPRPHSPPLSAGRSGPALPSVGGSRGGVGAPRSGPAVPWQPRPAFQAVEPSGSRDCWREAPRAGGCVKRSQFRPAGRGPCRCVSALRASRRALGMTNL